MRNVDASIKFKVSDDKLRVLANFDPAMGTGDSITPDHVLSLMSEQNIVFGIKNDSIEYICNSEKPLKNFLIAEGLNPQKGERARIESYFDINSRRKAFERDDGSVDFRDLGTITSASKGFKLYRRIPPTIGTPGKNVHGEEIPGLLGKDLKIVLGRGTEYDENDENLVIATTDGEIIVKDGVVHISEVHVVQGDVDFSTGNISFNGSVRISGTVKSGFQIKAVGDVEIHGNVEDATVIAGNDVIVLGGYTGTGDGLIQAGRDVIVKFIENQSIEANRDIVINGESYHAKLLAGRSIIGKSGKSIIVGGQAEAKYSIEANKFGSVAAAATLIKVGIDPKLAEKIKCIETEIASTKESKKKLEQSVIFLYKLKIDNNGKLPPDKNELLKKLETAKQAMPEKLKILESKLQRLHDQQKEVDEAFAIAEVAVYPKVRIYIGNQWLSIEDTLGPSTFKMIKGEVLRLSK